MDKIGRYEIREIIREGHMAAVYRAYDPLFDREVAIKVLPERFLDDDIYRARFNREAKVVAQLQHPAIVPVFDLGAEAKRPYIVMQYLPGGTLDERIRQALFDVEQAARIFKRLAPGLDLVHRRGIIHRDLKPANILFDAYGNAYLTDFGIAKISDASGNLTGGKVVGTPNYMSPEQVMAEPMDGRSDIYTLGIVLYQMFTGDVPFRASSPIKLALKHIHDPVPSVLALRSDLSPACDAVIQRATAKPPEDRYPTVVAMAEALATAAS